MATATPRKTAAPRKRAAAPKTSPATPPTPVDTSAEGVTGLSTEDGVTRIGIVLNKGDDTKSYAVFTFPEGSGCVGKVYVPKGVETVKMVLIGPAE